MMTATHQPLVPSLPQRWLTVQQAAAVAGVHRNTVYTAIQRGDLQASRPGGGWIIRINPDDLEAWLRAKPATPQ